MKAKRPARTASARRGAAVRRMGARAEGASRPLRRAGRARQPGRGPGKRGAPAQWRGTDARELMRGCSTYPTPDGDEQVRALTVFLVNRRAPVHRFYADVGFVFQARLELVCPQASGRGATSPAIGPTISTCASPTSTTAMCANGRSAAMPPRHGTPARSKPGTSRGCGPIRCRRPKSSASRPTRTRSSKARVTFGMEALAERAGDRRRGTWPKRSADLPVLYGQWIEAERGKLAGLPARRRETGGAPHRRDGDRAPAHPRGHRGLVAATISRATPSAT